MAVVQKIGLFPSAYPYCIGEGTPSITGSPFVNLTVDEILQFYWRIKCWKFSFSATVLYTWETPSGTEQTTSNFQVEKNLFSNVAEFGEDERTHVCTPVYGYGCESLLDSVGFWQLRDMLYQPYSNESWPVVWKDGDNYGIEWYFGFFEQNDGGDNFLGWEQDQGTLFANGSKGDQLVFLTSPQAATGFPVGGWRPESVSTTCQIKFGDKSLEGALRVDVMPNLYSPPSDRPPDAFNGAASSVLVVSVSNCKLETTQWWPYDPHDGMGPIYNAETGQQIRPYSNWPNL